nr:SKP1-like protein 4 [Tanacetum cinerariifolium]
MSNQISLTSSNGESFSIDEEAAKLSLKLKTIIDQKDDLVKNISSITLSKVIEYCSKHVPNNDADEEALKLFDQEFVSNVDKVSLLYLVEAAKDLKIKGLYDLSRESLINKLAVSGNDEILLLLNREDLKSVNETLFELADKALVKRCSSGGP